MLYDSDIEYGRIQPDTCIDHVLTAAESSLESHSTIWTSVDQRDGWRLVAWRERENQGVVAGDHQAVDAVALRRRGAGTSQGVRCSFGGVNRKLPHDVADIDEGTSVGDVTGGEVERDFGVRDERYCRGQVLGHVTVYYTNLELQTRRYFKSAIEFQ